VGGDDSCQLHAGVAGDADESCADGIHVGCTSLRRVVV
jgi:hypothetical protein